MEMYEVYNDVKNKLTAKVANIIYAVTNEKGKSRKERANSKYYSELVKVEGAVFVKLCDRMANITHSNLFNHKPMECDKLKMYRNEHYKFVENLGIYDEHPLIEMFYDLEKMTYHG
jgi:hypothetical protein